MSPSTVPANADRPLAHLRSNLPCNPEGETLVEVLRRVADRDPDLTYVSIMDTANQSTPLSFSRILTGAERWARYLLARGLEPGARVALLLPTGEDFLAALFGTQIAGGIPAPLAYPLALGDSSPYVLGFAPIIANARPHLFITTESFETPARSLLEATGRKTGVIVPNRVDEAPARSYPTLSGEQPALLQYSSGPVGDPTGVVLSHRHVLTNVLGMGRALSLSRDDVALTWVPLVHDMGLVGGLFTSLYWQCPLHVMPPQSFLMHPHRWLQNITDLGVTLSVAPNFAFQLCVRRVREKQMAALDLRSWRLALNGAETVHPKTVEAFCEKFEPVGFSRRAMLPTYGLAENTLATACPDLAESYVTEPDPDRSDRNVVSVGGPLAGQELGIVDDGGEMLPEHRVGEITVKGPCVMEGYFERPETNERILRDGWLRTGDLGFVADGRLFITSRKKEMVIKMGRNYYPGDIEQALTAGGPSTVENAVAFAAENPATGTEDLVLIIGAEPQDPEAEKKLRNDITTHVLSTLGIRADEVVFVPPDQWPSERDRSTQRREMRARWAREGGA